MKAFRVALTNVTGLGATELTKSLLPALEQVGKVTEIYLPASGPLADYQRVSPGPKPKRTRRRLPNAISRFLECTLLSSRLEGATPLLVLGDLPVRIRAAQTIFVHTPHLLEGSAGTTFAQRLKFKISRALFRTNAGRIGAAVVQTHTMKRGLEEAYPALDGRVRVVPQPAPQWLLESGMRRTGRVVSGGLRLFYPAATYPHKNHVILFSATSSSDWQRLVQDMVVTISSDKGGGHRTVRAVERLDPAGMRAEYARADALVFPSLAESYGLPLVEAMWLGLPIVCADLPYARDLCGEQAIYFAPKEPLSLVNAVDELSRRLEAGWWPDWSGQVQDLPSDWNEVAERLIEIVLDPSGSR